MTARALLTVVVLQGRLAAELVLEYASAGGPPSELRIGTHVVGGAVRGIGLDRAPRQP
jgi:hypothetical protein